MRRITSGRVDNPNLISCWVVRGISLFGASVLRVHLRCTLYLDAGSAGDIEIG